jgi:Na+-transporting NADH:ubiquinone oxidoreductase subunit C
MDNDSPAKALLVVVTVALVCSLIVSATVVLLEPVQDRRKLIEKSRNIIGLTGLVEPGEFVSEAALTEVVDRLDMRLLDIDEARFSTAIDPADYDARAARNDPALSSALPPGEDLANIGRRERYAVVYLIWGDAGLRRAIFPVYGQGMWSTLYGFIALEADMTTVAAMTFYEQTETAGLGDQVQSREWLDQWQGRKIYADSGEVRFKVASAAVDPASPAAIYEVDVMTGATITGDAVTRLIRFWFGPRGYGPFLKKLETQPLERQKPGAGEP